MEFVSVDEKNNIVGFLRANISRSSNTISSLGILNFYDINITFSRDLRQFLTDLFIKYNFRKLEFSVVVGNPAEKMYDKYIEKYGGRIVGKRIETTRLQDNRFYDVKLYEIFKRDFEDKIKQGI